MTINRSIGQTPPDKANEIFAQLLATSNDAVETREQLLASLAQELDLLANLQEQHLFPVLENHPETAELVRGARDDNRQTRAFLDKLGGTPKDDDTFLAKVTELRTVFQQHIRNDKNELLPVVLKVLNEDEVEAVVEKVEEEIAEAEEFRRAASEPRRTRRGRKQAAAVPDADETLLAVIEAAPEAILDVEQEIQETAQATVPAASAIVDYITKISSGSGSSDLQPVGSCLLESASHRPLQQDPGSRGRNVRAGVVQHPAGTPAGLSGISCGAITMIMRETSHGTPQGTPHFRPPARSAVGRG